MKNINNGYRKLLYAGIGVLVLVAVIAAAAYGTLWNGGSGDGEHASAVELTHETGNGHELAEEAHGDDAGHHVAAATHEGEAEEIEVFNLTINAEEWRFAPSVVEVPLGHRVELTLVNNGIVEHDVEVIGVPAENIKVVSGVERHEPLGGGHHDEAVVAAHAEPGTTAIVIFTATEVGKYKFACTIPGHKEAGMVGKLVVTE